MRNSAIPLDARILQVVDVFDALTNNRLYRVALSPAAALETLEAEAARGRRDPHLVHVFRAVAGTAG